MRRPPAAIQELPRSSRPTSGGLARLPPACRFNSSCAPARRRCWPCESSISTCNTCKGACVLIDLNADLGEGCPHDVELLDSVSSINVACAWHAGSADEMLSLVRAALQRGIAIGAHPSFPDREHFGRQEMNLPMDSVRAGLLYQIGALDAMLRAEGGALAHVKAHGALYNQAAREPELAHCIARAIRDFNPRL